MPDMNDEYWDLVDRLVPDHGPADTVQGELVRATLRLSAECCRNGCGNWDAYFEALADFASEKFSDGTLPSTTTEKAQVILDRLRQYGRMVASPSGPALHSVDEEQTYRELCRDIDAPLEEAAAQWCQLHPDPIPFRPGPDYGASG
jgi:hypothetical protein